MTEVVDAGAEAVALDLNRRVVLGVTWLAAYAAPRRGGFCCDFSEAYRGSAHGE
jgi:hypothetical protein